jgi:hypothetical protein
MQVKFPKTGKLNWIMWTNYGHYLVVWSMYVDLLLLELK